MKNRAKDLEALFELINSIGEKEEGKLHIIDTSDEYPFEEEKKYRVYHKDGYCFDISKEVEEEDESTGATSYYYSFYSEWDEFKMLNERVALKLIRECQVRV